MRQRGFTLYLILGALVIIGILGALLKWQTSRLETCQTDKGRLEAAIDAQNAAVEAMRSEAARKAADGAKALKAASGRAKVWEADAARLRDALTNRKPGAPTDCGTAWQEIRKP